MDYVVPELVLGYRYQPKIKQMLLIVPQKFQYYPINETFFGGLYCLLDDVAGEFVAGEIEEVILEYLYYLPLELLTSRHYVLHYVVPVLAFAEAEGDIEQDLQHPDPLLFVLAALEVFLDHAAPEGMETQLLYLLLE